MLLTLCFPCFVWYNIINPLHWTSIGQFWLRITHPLSWAQINYLCTHYEGQGHVNTNVRYFKQNGRQWQNTFSNALTWMNIVVFRFKYRKVVVLTGNGPFLEKLKTSPVSWLRSAPIIFLKRDQMFNPQKCCAYGSSTWKIGDGTQRTDYQAHNLQSVGLLCVKVWGWFGRHGCTKAFWSVVITITMTS